MLVLLLYSTANSTMMANEKCGVDCTWVEVSTKTWVQTFTIETEVSETTEQYTYTPAKVTSKPLRKKGPNDSYICYVLLNGGSYGDYSVEPTSGSDNQTLYNAGKVVRECNFQYPAVRNVRNHVSVSTAPPAQWSLMAVSMMDVVEGGYWVESKGGYWDCTPAPVPEPKTLLLFGAGLLGLAGFCRRKK